MLGKLECRVKSVYHGFGHFSSDGFLENTFPEGNETIVIDKFIVSLVSNIGDFSKTHGVLFDTLGSELLALL
jgi:hypothetical protein